MDKKSIRINFNFNIAKNKNGRNNSHFKTKHYKNKDIDYIEGEIWKPIKDFENVYYVSNKGRIKNIISNKLMSNFIVGDYYKVSLYSRQYFVHKLVASAFIPNLDNKPCVDHIDTNSLNNNVENLRWVTIKENNNNPIIIAKQKDRLKSYNNIEIFDSVLDAAKSVNDSSTNISRVCKNNSKVSIPRYLCKKILLYV